MHQTSYSHEHELDEHDFLGCCLNCRRSLEIIKPHVLGFYERIKGHTATTLAALSQDELYRKYQLLDDIAQLDIGDSLGELILTDPEIAGVLPVVRSYYAAFFSLHELYQVRRMLASEDPRRVLESYPLYPRYQVLAATQGKALNLSSDDTLAFVGCGALPISLIALQRLLNVRSVGLDVDPQAVSLARKCVDHLGLRNEITIVEGDESQLAGLSFTAVLVAALAEPKARIFRTLRRVLRDRGPVPVVYRTYTGIRAVLYQPVLAEDIEGFTVVGRIEPTGQVNNTQVVLELNDHV